MVGLLALDALREAAELRAQRVDPDRVGRLVEPVARDRLAPVGQAQLDERRRAVLLGRAVEGEGVRVGRQLGGRQLVQRARVADLVLRDRGEGDVLLQERSDPGPLGVAPAEDELVVSDLK
jgi:hypothetical protein